MQRIRYQGLTNKELAKQLDNSDVRNLSREDLEHVAQRFVEIFVRGAAAPVLEQEVTQVPYLFR
jgi:hypothetical protein